MHSTAEMACGAAVAHADAVRAQAKIERHALCARVRQPRGHDVLKGKAGATALQRVAIAPVDLRAEIIHHLFFPACGQPRRHIAVLAVEVVVGIPLRTDAKAQRRVCSLHRVVHLLDQSGHVLPPPCCKVCRTAGRKLRRIDAFFGRRVKIIVKVDAVHRVVLQKLGHTLHHIVRRCRLGRVQIQPVAHCTHPFRVGVGKVVLCQIRRHGCRGPQPVGIQPRFHRKAAPVGLLQKDVQRVKTGVLPLGAGAKVAERKIPAGVQGISKGPHMGKNGVCL